MTPVQRRARGLLLPVAVACLMAVATTVPVGAQAEEILEQAGVKGGFVVHLGCGDGELTAALKLGSQYMVHGLDTDPANVDAAREHIKSLGEYGSVSVDHWDGKRLPYADGSVNLVVAEGGGAVREAMRVLAPLGVLMLRTGDSWEKRTKPWPDEIDEWSHYLHDADNNAVAHDELIAPPKSLQWTGSPRWARHHDRLASMSAMVTAGGRLFYIQDEGSTASIVLESNWKLIARDAFNGVILWKQPIPEWQTRLWPLKSGPAQLPKRLVTDGERVYVTLGIDVPVTALDAATGGTVRTYEGTEGAEELLHLDGRLFVLVDPSPNLEKYTQQAAVNKPWWSGEPKSVLAVDAASGETAWTYEASVVPLTLTAHGQGVYFHDGEKVVGLDRETGALKWESEPVPLVEQVMSFFAPTLVAQDGVVLFAGGEESGLVKSGGGAVKNDTLSGLDAETGEVLWTTEHAPSGYSSPEDVFVIDGTVWFGGVSNNSLPGTVMGVDLHTGEVKHRYEAADVETYWFHHRCYRGKASSNYLMVARTGTEFIDPTTGHWEINHWARGGCMYGIMPANGLMYMPSNACACYPESKLFGLNALSAQVPPNVQKAQGNRLQRGPAFGQVGASAADAGDWPTLRHDALRSGATEQALAPEVAEAWKTELGGKLSTVTVADGKAYVAQIDAHTVHALDAGTGEEAWSFTAGARVDSPPTVHEGMATFGCADGHIYCLRADDGELVWKFRAAPQDTRIMAFEQLESRWPVHGSVLVRDGVVYAVAGKSLFLDGGMRLVRLEAATGKLLSEEVLDDRDPETGGDIQDRISRLTMPVALPDVLSSDGRHVYMRSQVFDMEGNRGSVAIQATKVGEYAAIQDADRAHLFSSAGFLDETWYHRSYWIYGSNFEGGWNSYYLAGQRVPAGKILSYDEDSVYGFGRQPKYFRWTTPMEFHLFSAPLKKGEDDPVDDFDLRGTIIRVEKSESLNPTGKALAAMAWVRTEDKDGVVVVRGGNQHGYAIYLKGGIPRFAIRAKAEGAEASASEAISGDWTHLAGVLTADAELRLYVNGELAGTATAPGLLTSDPAESVQVGGDEGSEVGTYNDIGLKGIIDEVRIYHGELPEAAIRGFAGAAEEASTGEAALVMHLSFNQENASDTSGQKNHGTVIGAMSARGQSGAGMRFSGRMPDGPASGVVHNWSEKVPLLVRGMVLAGDTLFVAGPDDVLDEPAALQALEDPETHEKLKSQAAAFAGESGGILRAVAAADGSVLAEQRLDTIPVWDGLAAADGALFMVGADGSVRRYERR